MVSLASILKSRLTFVLVTLFYSTTVTAQAWENLGDVTAYGNRIVTKTTRDEYQDFGKTPMAIGKDGMPYITIHSKTGKATVLKFDGQKWDTVGQPNFSDSTVDYISIAIAPSGIPYVVYQDASAGYRATVKAFKNGNWMTVGNKGFTNDALSYYRPFDYSAIAIAPDGTPYIAYTDTVGRADGIGQTINAVQVMKFNGSNWINMDTTGLPPYGASNFSLKIAADGTIYLACNDDESYASVLKWNGSEWNYVGRRGFSGTVGLYGSIYNGGIVNIDIAINQQGQPYVIYSDLPDSPSPVGAGDNRKAFVQEFNGNQWDTMGEPGFSKGWARYPNIDINNQGTPYVAYQDFGISDFPAVVKKFENNHWVNVGDNVSFNGGNQYGGYPSIVLNKDGTPYILYYTPLQKDNLWGIVVKRFNPDGVDTNHTCSCLKLYPNPNNGIFIIQGKNIENSKQVTITVVDMQGRVVYKTITKPIGDIIKLNLQNRITNGLYLVHLNLGSNSKTFKTLILH